MNTLIAVLVALLIIAIAAAVASGKATVWWRRITTGDTRIIVEPPVKRMAIRCGKCQCKFTYTARDVVVSYRESRVHCPACKQRLRIFTPDRTEAFGMSDSE
jgi:Zn finger protein HypA/HybF involved in hydrogenase expression